MVASGYRHTDLLIHTSKLEAIVTVTQHIMHDTQQQTIQWDRCPTLIGAHLFNTNFYNPLLHEFIELPQHKEPVAMETIMTNHNIICKQAVLLLQVHWPAYQTHWPAHLTNLASPPHIHLPTHLCSCPSLVSYMPWFFKHSTNCSVNLRSYTYSHTVLPCCITFSTSNHYTCVVHPTR